MKTLPHTHHSLTLLVEDKCWWLGWWVLFTYFMKFKARLFQTRHNSTCVRFVCAAYLLRPRRSHCVSRLFVLVSSHRISAVSHTICPSFHVIHIHTYMFISIWIMYSTMQSRFVVFAHFAIDTISNWLYEIIVGEICYVVVEFALFSTIAHWALHARCVFITQLFIEWPVECGNTTNVTNKLIC